MRRLRHRLMRIASWLPDPIVRWMDHYWRWRDECEFSFWTDASYWAYCRRDQKL